MVPSSTAPSRLTNRSRSIDRICPKWIAEGTDSPVPGFGRIGTATGCRAKFDVIAATMVIGLRALPMSFWTTIRWPGFLDLVAASRVEVNGVDLAPQGRGQFASNGATRVQASSSNRNQSDAIAKSEAACAAYPSSSCSRRPQAAPEDFRDRRPRRNAAPQHQ